MTRSPIELFWKAKNHDDDDDRRRCERGLNLDDDFDDLKDLNDDDLQGCERGLNLDDDDFDDLMMICRGASGDYICSAVNGVGHPAHATLTLTVLCESFHHDDFGVSDFIMML